MRDLIRALESIKGKSLEADEKLKIIEALESVNSMGHDVNTMEDLRTGPFDIIMYIWRIIIEIISGWFGGDEGNDDDNEEDGE